ncbi:MAG TPA: EAL domain-containing protein [Streptosporangiaceae bacterium]|nr:EAL domain-containing protein [Streptosporangiaceae bacterium]
MAVSDVTSPAHVMFSPIVDLDTGEVVAVETHGGPEPGEAETVPPAVPPAGRPGGADGDVRRALRAARMTAETRTRLPLLLTLRAETVAEGRRPLTTLHHGLAETGRRPHEVIVCVFGGFAPAQRPLVRSGISGLHAAGYLTAFAGVGAAHAPLDILLEGPPYLLKLDAELARSAARDPRHRALVEALVMVARRIGGHVLAPGVAGEEQLARLRALGVRLAQGPLLTPAGWRPATGAAQVPVPVPPAEVVTSSGPIAPELIGPRVTEFLLPAVTMPDTVTADSVLTVLSSERGTTSIVLVDEQQRPRYSIDRTRFLLAVSGPYGHALHAQKPAARLADAPCLVPRTVPAIAALRAAGDAGDRAYDDLVVVDEVGRCIGVVRVSDLIRGVTR